MVEVWSFVARGVVARGSRCGRSWLEACVAAQGALINFTEVKVN